MVINHIVSVDQRLPKKKAPGPDGISTAALRHLPRRSIVAINRVFNGIPRTGDFIVTWKGEKSLRFQKRGRIREDRRIIGLSPRSPIWQRYSSMPC
ncbi:Probable RNA-directed DNA polymerase from transposon BS [Eumeta japonica]|uniref:Probable RNA-directed DNA polymerase from transposon BS n=1 Tax=Eumeta variegata TaxID=151549 RepID=A0A4C1Z430_EUMVA|nr:Probable RNA-directed DNA polymerase from transposon BS [Eumeta japonica]